MKNLVLFALLVGAPQAFAAGQCTVCLGDVSDEDIAHHRAYVCTDHHCIDQECLARQVENVTNIQDLEHRGLSCCGEKCKERLALSTIRDLLEPTQRAKLDERIIKAWKLGDSDLDKLEVIRLSEGIEDSFNLCCPYNGCGDTLDKIEGCNAATCSNQACEATFCYLCLKPQESYEVAHSHAKGHSGHDFEFRSGFTARYHWILARGELALLFKRKIDLAVKKLAMESRRAILEEKNMWPLPAGMRSSDWIEEVKKTPLSKQFTAEKRIELLQNEYIYLHQRGDKKNAEVVQAELQRMGAPVLSSLDIQDAPAEAHERLEPVLGEEQRGLPRPFVAMGDQLYKVGNVIFSSAAKGRNGIFGRGDLEIKTMNWDNADRYCRGLGEGVRLPTRQEYSALGHAMGFPDNYNRNMIADMAQNWFWSSSVSPNNHDFFYRFNGKYGYSLNFISRHEKGGVRCARSVR